MAEKRGADCVFHCYDQLRERHYRGTLAVDQQGKFFVEGELFKDEAGLVLDGTDVYPPA